MRHTFVLAVLVATAACSGERPEEIETSAAVPVTVETARVETLESTMTVSGTVTPAPGAELIVTAPESARIAELPHAEGDAVKAGDVLVRFDIPNLAADLEAKRAAVKQASARLETFKANVARLAGLVERGVAAQREVEEARREQSEAEADLAQAQSGVTAATALAARATARATFAGVIARRWHNPGDFVEPGAGDPVLRVIDPSRLLVVAAVPVANLARVAVGHSARIIGPGGGEGEPGTIQMRSAQADQTGATADVRVTFRGRTNLPAGALVQVEIVTERRPRALVIPSGAVVHDGDETFVMVAGSDNKAHKRAVQIGLTAKALVEVTSGLKEGEAVIVNGLEDLPDNAAISISK